MYTLGAEEAKAVDQAVRERFGIPTISLMENAGSAVCREALALCPAKERFAVLCGKGNNGGDGFVCARHLLAAGRRVTVFLAAPAAAVRNEARVNLDILLKLGQPVVEVTEAAFASVRRKMQGCALIIDGLFGVGLSGPVQGVGRRLIEAVNRSGRRVLSIDIPSGLDATTGSVKGACVKADVTVTFMALKKGMIRKEGPSVCGRIVVERLGVPRGAIEGL